MRFQLRPRMQTICKGSQRCFNKTRRTLQSGQEWAYCPWLVCHEILPKVKCQLHVLAAWHKSKTSEGTQQQDLSERLCLSPFSTETSACVSIPPTARTQTGIGHLGQSFLAYLQSPSPANMPSPGIPSFKKCTISHSSLVSFSQAAAEQNPQIASCFPQKANLPL